LLEVVGVDGTLDKVVSDVSMSKEDSEGSVDNVLINVPRDMVVDGILDVMSDTNVTGFQIGKRYAGSTKAVCTFDGLTDDASVVFIDDESVI